MHFQKLKRWQHSHEFSLKNKKGERRTQFVLILTAATMVVEIIAGSLYGSMALLADGWHMCTHVAAFMIALFAYRYAAIISLVTHHPYSAEHYKRLLSNFYKLSHITIEVNECRE